MDRSKFKLFGSFAYTSADGRRRDILLSKDIGLLAAVALSKNCSCSRSKIMDLLWSDRSETQGRASLRHSLWSIKQVLNRSVENVFEADRRQVWINRSLCQIDVIVFLELSHSGSRQDLEKSVSIYTGDLLEGLVINDPVWQEWIRLQNENLRSTYAENLFTLSECYLSERNTELLIRTGRQMIEHNNLCERGHCALMKGYYLGQQKSLALQQFDHYRNTIMQELHSFPDRNVLALYEQIKYDRNLFSIAV